MIADTEEKALRNLKNRIYLLSRGVVMPDDSVPIVHLQSRQGGAGPRGIACYVGDAPGNYNGQISLVVYPKSHYLAKYALPTKWWLENKPDGQEEKRRIAYTEENIFLEEVPFSWKEGWFRGKKTAYLVKTRFHPYRTYSMSLYRWCRHLDNHEECKFCTNSLLLERYQLPKRASDRMNLKHLKLGMACNPVRSVTLTSGTMETVEATATALISFARQIRKKTNLTIHVQSEPIFDRTILMELSQVADSIGIFLEMFDDKVRQRICPGKARIFTQEDYLRSWEMAVSYFGWGKVFTTNIIGFDEDYEVILQGVERAAKIGVLTSILLVRVGSPGLGNLVPSYIGQEDKVTHLYTELGKILVKNSVDNISLQNSGCLGCHGCSATKEAVIWAQLASKG